MHLFWCLVYWSFCGQFRAVVDRLWTMLWTIRIDLESYIWLDCGHCGQSYFRYLIKTTYLYENSSDNVVSQRFNWAVQIVHIVHKSPRPRLFVPSFSPSCGQVGQPKNKLSTLSTNHNLDGLLWTVHIVHK